MKHEALKLGGEGRAEGVKSLGRWWWRRGKYIDKESFIESRN
jgi:hypothetical protein